MTQTLHPVHERRLLKGLAIAGAVLCTFLIVAVAILASHWPFSRKHELASLNKSFHGEVQIASFQTRYWPEPGFIARGIVLRRTADPSVPPLATADSLIVAARWANLLALQHRVRLIELENLHIVIPAANTEAREEDFPPGDGKDFSGPATYLEVLHLHNSTLEIGGQEKPFVLPIPDLLMQDVVKGNAASFKVDVLLPKPSAKIHGSGSLGPLHSTRLGETPVSVNFDVKDLSFEDIGSLHGSLEANGTLHGTLAAIQVSANTQTADFAVGRGRGTTVRSALSATVDGLNGDTVLHSIDAHTGATDVHASGTVRDKPKAAKLEFRIVHGHIEDIMRPFMATPPSVSGDLRGSASATLAPSRRGMSFFDRLGMDAHFTLPDEKFTKPSTEANLSAFSRRAQGVDLNSPQAKPDADEPDALLSISGPAQLRNGIARTDDLSVLMPGAQIHLAGTFDLKSQTAHLTGNLTMKPDLSHVTTGFKSKLLKPLSPFFRHRRPNDQTVTVIPIAVTGTKHYKVGGNLFGNK